MEFIKLVQSNGGILNGSTRFDFTNYFEVAAGATRCEHALWAEADRMRGLQITQDNLVNQQGVVKNEVQVNVLNQPYGGFPWLDMPQHANMNWYNAHNFYGDLDGPRRGDARADVERVLQDVLRAEQRRRRRGPATSSRRRRSRGCGSTSPTSRPGRSRRSPTSPSRGRRRRSAARGTIRSPSGRRSGIALPRAASGRRRSGTPSGCSTRCCAGARRSLYDELVRKRALAGGVGAGINVGLGNMFNYKGPMLYTPQLIHDTDKPADTLVAAIDVVDRRRCSAAPVDQATLDRALVKMRSLLYATIE